MAASTLPFCVKCKLPFPGQNCPYCGRRPAHALRQFASAVQPYYWVWMAGLLGSVATLESYPLVAPSVPNALLLIALFGPIAIWVFLSIRYPDPYYWTVPLLKNAFGLGSISLVVLALFFWVNGALDKLPADQFHASVISTHENYGRGHSYFVTITPGLQAGETQDTLEIGYYTFQELYGGEPIAVSVHKGRFDISWYDHVVPR